MVFSWFIFGALIFHAQALVCDGSAYILEFLTFNKGPIVFLMSHYLEQASKGAGVHTHIHSGSNMHTKYDVLVSSMYFHGLFRGPNFSCVPL